MVQSVKVAFDATWLGGSSVAKSKKYVNYRKKNFVPNFMNVRLAPFRAKKRPKKKLFTDSPIHRSARSLARSGDPRPIVTKESTLHRPGLGHGCSAPG